MIFIVPIDGPSIKSALHVCLVLGHILERQKWHQNGQKGSNGVANWGKSIVQEKKRCICPHKERTQTDQRNWTKRGEKGGPSDITWYPLTFFPTSESKQFRDASKGKKDRATRSRFGLFSLLDGFKSQYGLREFLQNIVANPLTHTHKPH